MMHRFVMYLAKVFVKSTSSRKITFVEQCCIFLNISDASRLLSKSYIHQGISWYFELMIVRIGVLGSINDVPNDVGCCP